MAKISKKPPGDSTPEAERLKKFFFEEMEEAGLFLESEPITQIPNVDVFSTRDELIIEVELPGVKKQDIDITILKNTLTVKALKLECFEEEKVNYVCMERSFGRMFRSIELPYPVDKEKIRAVFRSGILTISLPKVEDKRHTSRRVPIESA